MGHPCHLRDTVLSAYLPKHFPIHLQYKFGEKKYLRHFFHIFSELHFVEFSVRCQKEAEEDSTH